MLGQLIKRSKASELIDRVTDLLKDQEKYRTLQRDRVPSMAELTTIDVKANKKM